MKIDENLNKDIKDTLLKMHNNFKYQKVLFLYFPSNI